MMSFSINDQIIVGEDLILPAIDLYGVIVDAIGVSVIKLVHTQSRSAAAAACYNFEVIGLGVVVDEVAISAYPDLVFSTGIVRVVIPEHSEATGRAVHDRNKLITVGENASGNSDRSWSALAQNGAIRRGNLHTIRAIRETIATCVGRSAVDVHFIFGAVDV